MVSINLCLATSVKGPNLNDEKGILEIGDASRNLIIKVTCDSNYFACVRSLINSLHEYLTVKWRSHTCVWQKGDLRIAARRFSFSATRIVTGTPASGKGKEISPVRRSSREKSVAVSVDSDSSSDEEETYEMKPRAMKTLATDLMYRMIDFQTHLNVETAENIVWLRELGLHDFAQLPWERYTQNIYGPTQLSVLQTTQKVNSVTGIEKEITVEFFAEHFLLPNTGETTWEKATDDVMQAQFGRSETRGYYVLKKVADNNRRNQLTWMMERIFLLVKLDYMSRETFGCIMAAESGKKLNWAHIMQSRFVMDVKGVDKRKQSGVTKISPFLYRMFEIAKSNEWSLCLPSVKVQKSTKAQTQKGKKTVQIEEELDDEPPVKKSKTGKGIHEENEDSKQSVKKGDTGIIEDMLNMGFKATYVEESMQKSLGGLLDNEIFQMPLKTAVPHSRE